MSSVLNLQNFVNLPTCSATPSLANQLVTKSYVDTNFANVSGVNVYTAEQIFTYMSANNLEVTQIVNIITVITVVNGSESGSISCTMPFVGTSYNKIIIYCNNLVGTASYTFPGPFRYLPGIFISDNGPAPTVVTSLSTTAVTITGSGATGIILLEGI